MKRLLLALLLLAVSLTAQENGSFIRYYPSATDGGLNVALIGTGLPIYRWQHTPTTCDNLISHWSMNEASGTRVDSTDGNDLADAGSVTATTGKLGDAADFDGGAGNYLDKATPTGLLPASFTVTVWAAPTSLAGSTGRFVWNFWDSTDFVPYLELRALTTVAPNYNWRVQFSIGGGTKNLIFSTVFSTSTTFHFIAFKWDGGAGIMYMSVDGATFESLASTGSNLTPATPRLRVGASSSGVGRFLGQIDELNIFSVAKTNAEILALYNQGNGFACP